MISVFPLWSLFINKWRFVFHIIYNQKFTLKVVDGTDENGGKYDKYGEYLNGPNFNSEIGMYKDDIKNSSFDDENELKQEIKESQEVEFEKIKNEGYESKNLIISLVS